MDDKHCLGVAYGGYFNPTSAIYQWDGQRFVSLQNVSLKGASRLNFFTEIFQERYLAVTNTYESSTTIYKWKGKQVEKFQEIHLRTEDCYDSAMFAINNETFIAFASYWSQQRGRASLSSVYKWSGDNFVKIQSLQTYTTRDVKSFSISGDTFVVFADYYNGSSYNIDSFIYKWNGNMFVLL